MSKTKHVTAVAPSPPAGPARCCKICHDPIPEKEFDCPVCEPKHMRSYDPPDGPAKVFGMEGTPIGNEAFIWPGHRMKLSKMRDGKWCAQSLDALMTIGADRDECARWLETHTVEALSALLSLIPPEQVVGAMSKEVREKVFAAIKPALMAGITRGHELLRRERDDAEEMRRTALEFAELRMKERDEWKRLAQERKVLIDRATGALTDSGIAPTYPPEAGILALTAERDQAIRERADRATSDGIDINQLTSDLEQCRRSLDEETLCALREKSRAEQAERERDEARAELERCKACCRERIQEVHQWEQWFDLSPRGLSVDAPPLHPETTDDARVDALLAQAESVQHEQCPVARRPGGEP